MRFPIIVILIFLTAISYGQNIKKKWVLIKDNNEISLYIDQGNIKELDNQISIWSLKIYKNPSLLTKKGKLIGKEKAQYLINKLNKKYSLIGKIRYDDVGRIIREIDPFEKIEQEDVSKNENVNLLFKNAIKYLNSGSIDEISPKIEEVKEDSSKATEEKPEGESNVIPKAKPVLNENINKVSKDNAEQDTKEKKVEKKKENDFLIFVGKKKVTTEIENKFDESGIESTEVELAKPVITKEEPKEEIKNSETSIDLYDKENDKLVRGRIFTDGIFYSVQVSAWKSEIKAKREVERYKRKGYKAFMLKANIPGKGIWYRVRVGVYESYDEAKKALRKL